MHHRRYLLQDNDGDILEQKYVCQWNKNFERWITAVEWLENCFIHTEIITRKIIDSRNS